MNLRTVVLLLALTPSSAAFGAVIVTPPFPTTSDTITIRLENWIGGSGGVTSASIMQVGNTFVIQQNGGSVYCLPTSSYWVSEFQVGPLPIGTYDVTANIYINSGSIDPCAPEDSITQTATFVVGATTDVPALDGRGLFVLAVALAVSGLVMLKLRRGVFSRL